MGLEILEQTPDVEAIVVPVGGGGLIAGIGTVVKAKAPHGRDRRRRARARARASPRRSRARRPVAVALSPTLADGLAVAQIGAIAVRDRRARRRSRRHRRRGVDRARDPAPDRAREERRRRRRRRAARRVPRRQARHAQGQARRAGAVPAATSTSRSLGRVIDVGPRRRRPALRASPSRSATGRAASRGSPRSSRRPARRSRRSCTTARSPDPDLSAVRVVCVVETTGPRAREAAARRAAADAGINVVG